MESIERAFLCKRIEEEEEAAAAVKEEVAGITEEERQERVAAKAASMKAISSSVTISIGISGTFVGVAWASGSVISSSVCGYFKPLRP